MNAHHFQPGWWLVLSGLTSATTTQEHISTVSVNDPANPTGSMREPDGLCHCAVPRPTTVGECARCHRLVKR